jgi:hypothetical protein
MRVPWKVLGLAGVAGVAATGVVVARKRRAHTEYDPDELRERLHGRLGEVAADAEAETAAEPEPATDEAEPATDETEPATDAASAAYGTAEPSADAGGEASADADGEAEPGH